MIADISNRLAQLMSTSDFHALENDEECRRALGFLLLEKDQKGQGLGPCEAFAKYARFPGRDEKRVALMIAKWPGADWGTPRVWAERFY